MVTGSSGTEKSRIENATIQDIVNQIREAEKNGAKFITTELAEQLRGRNNTQTAKNIWSFIRQNITYREDGNHQKTQSPAHLWKTRVGDCKSMTVFGASILQKMCIPYKLVIDFYYPSSPNRGHIYIELPGGIVLDPVNSQFNKKDSAWKSVKIPGHKICSSGIGSTNNKNITMSTIASYIEGTGRKPKGIAVPKPHINYAEMTDGELSVKLVARQNELFYLGTGDEKFKKAASELNKLVDNSITGYAIKSNSQLEKWAERKIRENSYPAVSAYYFTLYNRDRAKVGQLYTFDQWRENEFKRCVDIREKWAKMSVLRFERRRELRKEWEACFNAVGYLGTVNDQLEKSGAHLLYNFAGGSLNTTVAAKKVLHRIAVDNYSRVFGLSPDNISLWIRNGIIAGNLEGGAGALSPEETYQLMAANIPDNYESIGAVVETLTIIINVISVALAATQMIMARIGEVERQRLLANTQGLGTAPFGPEKQDFLSEVQSALFDQGLIIPLGILAAVLFLE